MLSCFHSKLLLTLLQRLRWALTLRQRDRDGETERLELENCNTQKSIALDPFGPKPPGRDWGWGGGGWTGGGGGGAVSVGDSSVRQPLTMFTGGT